MRGPLAGVPFDDEKRILGSINGPAFVWKLSNELPYGSKQASKQASKQTEIHPQYSQDPPSEGPSGDPQSWNPP